MSNNQKFSLVVTIVNKGFSDYVIDASRRAGASGGTIITGRGSGDYESENFLGIVIQPEKEIILTVVKNSNREKVMKTISDDLSLKEERRGFCFSLPIENISGVAHLISRVDKEKED